MIDLSKLSKEQKQELLEYYNTCFKELAEFVTLSKLFIQFLKED